MSEHSADQTRQAAFLRNPFAVKSPEELTREQIVRLFVPDYTQVENVKERKHTFIWGSRGSGKSMMLRYLEPSCMRIKYGSIESFLDKADAFIGVYCPCKEGQLNKTELTVLKDGASQAITEHIMNMNVARQVLRCLCEQFPGSWFSLDDTNVFASRTLALFDKASIVSSLADADESANRNNAPLKWLGALFHAEQTKIARFLRDYALSSGKVLYNAATTGYHDFLLPFIRAAHVMLKQSVAPFYILLDDADRLLPLQQSIVNTWMANRDQRELCFKVSSRREGYLTFETRDGTQIEEPHDYSTVDVDELYTESKSDYAKKVVLIANRRLGLSNVPTKDIEKFLPPDPYQEQLLSQVKTRAAEEWETSGRPGRQEDYVTRYATARLFQQLRKTKQRRNYAGLDNIVHLSSGVTRDFLEPCYLMFGRLLEKGMDPSEIVEIPPTIQDDVLFRYSEEFLIHHFSRIQQASPPEKWDDLRSLETLIASLGKLFYERLHDPESREARLFSFTVRGRVPADIEAVLQLGVRHRYFQLRSYSTKEGGGREKWYVLNRRLCPAFKLDPTGFEGRISITSDLLQLACRYPDKFVKLRLRQAESTDVPTLFSLEEGD